jgi:group I intron endonuclease
MKNVIYKIARKNGQPEDCYIGSSINGKYRWQKHRSTLKGQYHENIILQRAWNKYGEDSFEFVIIEQTTESTLLEREQFYIDSIKPRYNIAFIAGKPPIDPERSRKTAKVLHEKGIWGNDNRPVIRIAPTDGEKVFYTSQREAAEQNNNCTQPNISKTCLGYRRTHGGFYWKFVDGSSPEFVAKSGPEKEVIKYDLVTKETIQIYDSAVSVKGYDPSGISLCCNGKRKSYKGFGWKFADNSSTEWKSKLIPVVSYELITGKDIKKYDSISHAVAEDNYVQSNISLCCSQQRQSHKGLGWRFEHNEPILSTNSRFKQIEKVDLISNEVLKVYPTLSSTKEDGYSPNLIWSCVENKRRSHKGFGWKYVGEKKMFGEKLSITTPRIQSVQRGKIVETYSYLSKVKEDGFSPSKVSECCKGKRKSHKGFSWQYE